MSATIYIVCALALWLVIFECAPLALLAKAGAGLALNFPAHPVIRNSPLDPARVFVYFGAMPDSLGCATYCFTRRIILIDLEAWELMTYAEQDTLIAHEVAHLVLGHPRVRYWLVVSGLRWLRRDLFERVVAMQERDADEWAHSRVGDGFAAMSDEKRIGE